MKESTIIDFSSFNSTDFEGTKSHYVILCIKNYLHNRYDYLPLSFIMSQYSTEAVTLWASLIERSNKWVRIMSNLYSIIPNQQKHGIKFKSDVSFMIFVADEYFMFIIVLADVICLECGRVQGLKMIDTSFRKTIFLFYVNWVIFCF